MTDNKSNLKGTFEGKLLHSCDLGCFYLIFTWDFDCDLAKVRDLMGNEMRKMSKVAVDTFPSADVIKDVIVWKLKSARKSVLQPLFDFGDGLRHQSLES